MPGPPPMDYDLFQSTPPARGATPVRERYSRPMRYFNPRPPRGGRHFRPAGLFHFCLTISIHAPREGGDRQGGAAAPPHRVISIHAPREGGDSKHSVRIAEHSISIHAPREGGDSSTRSSAVCGGNFNPRPPRGGRRGSYLRPAAVRLYISIHAPREGGDSRYAFYQTY